MRRTLGRFFYANPIEIVAKSSPHFLPPPSTILYIEVEVSKEEHTRRSSVQGILPIQEAWAARRPNAQQSGSGRSTTAQGDHRHASRLPLVRLPLAQKGWRDG